MEHVIDWCFCDICKGGLWEDDLYVSVRWDKSCCCCRPSHNVETEAGQLGLFPSQPVSQLGLGSSRPGQLGLFLFCKL